MPSRMPSHPSLLIYRLATRLLLPALVGCAVLMPCGHAQENEEEVKGYDFIEAEHALPMNFVTPHTKWANPYHGGPLRAVFFALWFQGSTDGREIIELMQRFDLDARAVYLVGNGLVGDGNPVWYGGDPHAGANRVLRLLNESPAALFLNHVTLDELPETIVERVQRLVAEGMGVVIVGDAREPPFPKAVRVEPALGGLPNGEYFTSGKGRVVLLPKRAKLEYALGWEILLDHSLEQQGRALLWAARREPQYALTVTAPDTPVSRASLPADLLTVGWRDLPPQSEVRVLLQRWDGATSDLGSVPAHGGNAATFALPVGREGDYHVLAFAVDAGVTLDWAKKPLTIAADRHVDTVELDKDWAECDEHIEGRALLSGSLQPEDRVQVRLVDRRGRILAKQDFPAAPTVPFTFGLASWMPMLLRIEATILNGAEEVASAYAFLRITQRRRNQYNFVMWNVPSGDLAPYGVEALARYGVTAVLQQGPPPLCMASSGLAYVPYAASFRASSHTVTAMLDPATGFLKTGCVHDAEAMAKTIRKTVSHAQRAREHGVLAYSLGDENAVRASCLSPQCLEAYQQYLKDQYGAIEALNEEWETEYASFDEIQLLCEGALPAPDAPEWFREYYAERHLLHSTDNEGAQGDALAQQIAFGDINDEMRALQAGNFARWYDRQAFQNYSYVQWCKRHQEALREIDPQAWTGFEGTDSFSIRRLTTRTRQGGDLDAFVRELDYFGPYRGPANEVVRSIAPPMFPTGNWIGYTPVADELLEQYWEQITNGMNTVQWWRWDNLSGYHGYLGPSFEPLPGAQELYDDTRMVRDGLGTLLMQCGIYDDGIAMLYSLPSTYIAHFDGNETFGKYLRDHDQWHRHIHDAGLQFSYVTDRMLRRGEFDSSRYKVLILPLAFAMSSEEAEVIREFVRNGGAVIADVRPALYDGHCKPLEHGRLDDVFGIERTGKRDAREIDRMFVDGELNGVKLDMRWGNWHGKDIYPQMKVDPSVALSSGKAMGQAFHIHFWAGLNSPMCIVNEYGKGRAVLLNFAIWDAPAASLIRSLLSAVGVEPVIRISKPGGRSLKDVEVTRWSNGGMDLFALLGPYDGDVTVELPEARRVYDVRERRDLGLTGVFTVALRRSRASFFAALPDVVPTPELDLPESAMAGSPTEARVRMPRAAGKHAVKIRVTLPNGEPAEWLDQTVMAQRDAVPIWLPIAYNDPKGDWTVQAIELFSDVKAAKVITVH